MSKLEPLVILFPLLILSFNGCTPDDQIDARYDYSILIERGYVNEKNGEEIITFVSGHSPENNNVLSAITFDEYRPIGCKGNEKFDGPDFDITLDKIIGHEPFFSAYINTNVDLGYATYSYPSWFGATFTEGYYYSFDPAQKSEVPVYNTFRVICSDYNQYNYITNGMGDSFYLRIDDPYRTYKIKPSGITRIPFETLTNDNPPQMAVYLEFQDNPGDYNPNPSQIIYFSKTGQIVDEGSKVFSVEPCETIDLRGIDFSPYY